MSLDRNLFTLTVVLNESNPAVQDLVHPSGIVHYQKEREAAQSYRINLFDPMSQSLLASATAPHATSKHKTIELYNPSQVVEFKSTGTLTFRWSFSWEEHTFEWKRESCYLIRKPDPAVLVAITKEVQAKSSKSSTIQILDYNLNRFDIADRKGLEITLLTTLLTFPDLSAANNAPSAEPSAPPPPTARAESAPPLPPRPAPKTGIDRVAEMHAMRYEPNEVTVDAEGSIDNYGEYAEGLLADDAMLFITVRSASPADVPKVLQVVEHVKRLRHKREVTAGSLSEELHQYVIYDAQTSGGLQRIKLDDPPNAYTPPSSLTVHLSKIPMPELRPRAGAPSPPPKSPRNVSSSSLPRPQPQPPSPQSQARASSVPLEVSVPIIPTQQQQQQHPHAGIGSLLWGRPRKSQH